MHPSELTSNIDHLINVDTESDVLSLINEHDLEGIVDIEERCNDCEVTAESTIEDMKIISLLGPVQGCVCYRCRCVRVWGENKKCWCIECITMNMEKQERKKKYGQR